MIKKIQTAKNPAKAEGAATTQAALIVTPEQFHKEASIVLKAMGQKLHDHWYGYDNYTSAWEGRNDKKGGFYYRLAHQLNLTVYPEYWNIPGRMDAVFYKNRCRHANQNEYYQYAEFFSLVIEHENNAATSCEEMNKLSVVNAPLKVLFTYPRQPGIEWQPTCEDLRKKYAEQLDIHADVYKALGGKCDFPGKQEHMAVFGYYEEKEKRLRWEYFIYRKGKFVAFP